MVLSQHLSQVLVVEALILAASQVDNAVGGRAVDGVAGWLTPIAVRQPRDAVSAVSPVQPLDLPY